MKANRPDENQHTRIADAVWYDAGYQDAMRDAVWGKLYSKAELEEQILVAVDIERSRAWKNDYRDRIKAHAIYEGKAEAFFRFLDTQLIEMQKNVIEIRKEDSFAIEQTLSRSGNKK